jgi:parvulin-like peptidyl-prolyl isomerase
VIESQLYREKVMEAILGNLEQEQEQVWARHILVADEATARMILNQLKEGQDWYALAAQFSTDTSNKDQGGDLGWFRRGVMDAAFEEAAFKLEPGEISEPVQSQFGWHIIQVLGKAMRQLSPSDYEQFKTQEFQDWLTEQRDNSEVVIEEYWIDRVPTEPNLPPEVDAFIQQAQQPVPTSVIPTLPTE